MKHNIFFLLIMFISGATAAINFVINYINLRVKEGIIPDLVIIIPLFLFLLISLFVERIKRLTEENKILKGVFEISESKRMEFFNGLLGDSASRIQGIKLPDISKHFSDAESFGDKGKVLMEAVKDFPCFEEEAERVKIINATMKILKIK